MMIKKSILTVLIFTILGVFGYSQAKYPKYIKTRTPMICKGDDRVANTRIPPPARFLKSLSLASEKRADIIVTYRGFSTEAKKAFQQAVEIWETLIESPVPIYMDANWVTMEGSTLGDCTSNGYFLGLFLGARIPYAYYPIAVAEKMAKTDVNEPGEADLIANFNSDASWYYGSDGQTPSGMHDLISVVMHEIAHGIGFIGTMGVEGNLGGYGFDNGLVIAFDDYVEDLQETNLTDTTVYINPSQDLYQAMTSGDLYYSSPVALYNNENTRAELYAPSTFDPGSSIYHLDEFKYSSGNINSMMTPSISQAEAIHDPGPITMGMLADWGWIHTWIDFEPFIDRENLNEPFNLSIEITSDTVYYADTSFLVYSYDEFVTADTVWLSSTGTDNEFEANIPVDIPDRTVSYYVSTTDFFGREYTNPPDAPELFYQFYVGPDTLKPEIEHFPVEFILYTTDSLKIKAAVTDNIGVDSVFVEYFLNEDSQTSLTMQHDSVDDYSTFMTFAPGTLTPGDSIRYRIVAVDSSDNANSSIDPEENYYVIRVEDIREPQSEYQNDFNGQTDEFLFTGFSISTPDGFNSGGLHTNHPYESPDQDNQNIEYVAQLKIPIILKNEDAYMSFDDIALIEPGEIGTKWGDEEFWDYVVVEGSKDEGKTWKHIETGYDCRKHSDWFARYNSSMDGDNSTAVGTPNLYKSNLVNLLRNTYFNGGDTILIRFRLFSDPYAHGWGWAIDNLKIQGTVSTVENKQYEQVDIKVYPNPVRDQLSIEIQNLPVSTDEYVISVLDILGREIKISKGNTGSHLIREIIDISDVPTGLILVNFRSGNYSKWIRVLKIK